MRVASVIRVNTPKRLLLLYHFVLALLAGFLYRFPSRAMTVIGVTGTNGKSTVVEMLRHIFEEDSRRVASISSIRFQIGKHEWRNDLKMTMPGRFFLQRFLADARKRWRKNLPGIVIFKSFLHSCFPIWNRMDEMEATRLLSSSKMCRNISTTVDFPLVPVTPITVMAREGKRYKNPASNAKTK